MQSIEKRDPHIAGHTKRVVATSEIIAHYLDLDAEQKQNLKIAALLHDIGKVGIEQEILVKKDKLTEEEYKEIQKHPLIGVKLIGHGEHLKDVIPGMCYHHERTDGNGYPEGLKDTSIPLSARIIAVADAYDAMTTNRPYQVALHSREAITELQRCSGVQFDKQVVSAFIQAHDNGEIVTAEG
jgi:HD-GYP domain-containing protein (c-di-GMP phosphodiesterase class II)